MNVSFRLFDNITVVVSINENKSQNKVDQLNNIALQQIRSDLEITQQNMDIFSEMLTELTPGQEHPQVVRILSGEMAPATFSTALG